MTINYNPLEHPISVPVPSIPATLFVPPRGRRKQIVIHNILQADADYINENNIKVSVEEFSTGQAAFYFDDGTHLYDDPTEPPDEIIVVGYVNTSDDWQRCLSQGVVKLKTRKDIP